MAQKQLMPLMLAEGNGDASEIITILIMSSEEFDTFCNELQAITEVHRLSWADREALQSARRRRKIGQLARHPWTEDLFVKHGIETVYLAAFDNDHSLARNAILAARDSANRYDSYLELTG